jgi:hypothetical protein
MPASTSAFSRRLFRCNKDCIVLNAQLSKRQAPCSIQAVARQMISSVGING